MKTSTLAVASITLLVVNAAVAAAPSGYIVRKGKKTTVTAVYAHHEANTDVIVFNDRASATKAIEKKSQGGYATDDAGLFADMVFHDLASKGGHPIELTFMDDDEHTVTLLSLLEGKNKTATGFDPFSAKVEIVSRTDERIEGRATYDDGKTTMSLPFAIDMNHVGRAKPPALHLAPPPPPPPPTANPNAMLMQAADLLEAEIGDYYAHHGNTWPTVIDQVDKQAPDAQVGVASRKLGPDGVLTIVFAADAPFVGGRTVVFTPTPNGDGIEWHCATQGQLDGCQ
jgi:hypothetical protein